MIAAGMIHLAAIFAAVMFAAAKRCKHEKNRVGWIRLACSTLLFLTIEWDGVLGQ
jgi:hypothetical protein